MRISLKIRTDEYITLPNRAEVCSTAGLQELLACPLQGDGDRHCKAMSPMSTPGFDKPPDVANSSASQAGLQQSVEFSYGTRTCFQNIFASYTREINGMQRVQLPSTN